MLNVLGQINLKYNTINSNEKEVNTLTMIKGLFYLKN
jgi:hypothetical protein